MHKDLISVEMLNSLSYYLGALNMVSLKVVVIDSSVDGEIDRLVNGINDRWLSKGIIKAMYFLVGPGNEKVGMSSQQKVVLIDHFLESLPIAIFVRLEITNNHSVEKVESCIDDWAVC